MSPARTIQWIAFGGAFLFVVLLWALSPRLPQDVIAESGPLSDVDLKIKQAVELVEGPSPMQGIRMLQEVLADDPENLEALWHLGVFSVKSGQLEKAEGRFNEVLRLDEKGEYIHAHFYLGSIYADSKRYDEAIAELEIYKGLIDDQTVIDQVQQLINELKIYSSTN